MDNPHLQEKQLVILKWCSLLMVLATISPWFSPGTESSFYWGINQLPNLGIQYAVIIYCIWIEGPKLELKRILLMEVAMISIIVVRLYSFSRHAK